MARVRAPQSRAQASVSTISSVAPGLGQRHGQHAGQVHPAPVGGGDRRRGQCGQPPGVRLDQVAAVDGGVVGGPAGDEQHLAGVAGQRGGLAAPRHQRVQRGPQRRGLLPDLGPHRGRSVVIRQAQTCSAGTPSHHRSRSRRPAGRRRATPGRPRPPAPTAQVRPADQVGGDPGRGGHRFGQPRPGRDHVRDGPSIRSADPARPPSARRGGTPSPGASVDRLAAELVLRPAACRRTPPRR